MFNSIKKITSKYTGLLIRMDDISENMNWSLMDKCEKLFDKYNIKPLLGIIPINKDPELLKYPHNSKFWERVNDWQDKGWEITMHGLNHLYTQKSDKKDIFNYMKKLCFILLVSPILSFSQIDSESWKDYWNEQKSYYYPLLNGFWEESKEKVGLKGRFKNGKRVGKWKDYYFLVIYCSLDYRYIRIFFWKIT